MSSLENPVSRCTDDDSIVEEALQQGSIIKVVVPSWAVYGDVVVRVNKLFTGSEKTILGAGTLYYTVNGEQECIQGKTTGGYVRVTVVDVRDKDFISIERVQDTIRQYSDVVVDRVEWVK